jgi:hypothetical protein
MNKTIRHINPVVALLCLSLSAVAYGETVRKNRIVAPDLKPAPLAEAEATKAQVQDFSKLAPKLENTLVTRLDDVTIAVSGEANLATKRGDFVYVLRNVMDTTRRFRLVQPGVPRDKREMSLAARGEKTEQFRSDIQVANVSNATRQAIFRPYLMGATNQNEEKLLVAKYDTDVNIRLPGEARLVRSNVPLEKVSAAEYRWKVKGAPVLPPVHLWYTTAAENIAAKLDVAKGETVIVSVTVRNDSTTAATGLKLLTRFPAGKFEPISDESDGKFRIEQNVMHIWTASIDSLAGGESKKVTLKLRNLTGDQFPKVQEVAIHNRNGDLVAVAE